MVKLYLLTMEAAYRTLPKKLKQQVQGLTGKHCYAGAKPILGGREEWEFPLTPVTDETADQFPPPVDKPVVRQHSVSGRSGLYAPAGSMFAIEGVQNDEAYQLMHSVKLHAIKNRYCYSHQYRPGDVVMWDNTNTMHYAKPSEAATGDHDRRLMHRICPLGLPRYLS